MTAHRVLTKKRVMQRDVMQGEDLDEDEDEDEDRRPVPEPRAAAGSGISHRGAGLLLAILGLAGYQIWSGGKLGRAWNALNGAGAGAASTGSSGSGGTAQQASAPTTAGVPSAGLFGVNAAFSGYGESRPGVGALDQLGLTGFGGGTFAHDYDYAASAGSPVRLPPGLWAYLGDQTGKWGNLLGFRSVNDPSVTLELTHLEQLQNLGGATIAGGTQVGVVGYGPYDPSVWTGPHLSVITNTGAADYLNRLTSTLTGGGGGSA